jgi:hypothetical protein
LCLFCWCLDFFIIGAGVVFNVIPLFWSWWDVDFNGV